MEPNINETDPNAGSVAPGSSDAGVSGQDTTPPVQGTQNDNPVAPSGNAPVVQEDDNPAQPADVDARDKQINDLRAHNKSLNDRLVKVRRDGRTVPTPAQGAGQEGTDGNQTPATQYATALQVAENSLRGNLEEVIPLYPELSSDLVQQIRQNPWAYASRESFLTGDWVGAVQDIEEKMLKLAESSKKDGTPTTPEQKGGTPQPAQVSANPAPAAAPAAPAVPGSAEDLNPSTMPLDKLEGMLRQDQARQKAQNK